MGIWKSFLKFTYNTSSFFFGSSVFAEFPAMVLHNSYRRDRKGIMKRKVYKLHAENGRNRQLWQCCFKASGTIYVCTVSLIYSSESVGCLLQLSAATFPSRQLETSHNS